MASTYLSKTLSTPTNNKIWTYSVWLKLASAGSATESPVSSGTDANNRGIVYFNGGSNEIQYYEGTSGTTSIHLTTNRLFRDISAWYHIVLSVDTTQATASNRVKLYVNGVQETSLATATYPTQNYNTKINSAVGMSIGSANSYGGTLHFSGSMSHIHFIDGTAYDATAFGEVDSTTGQWEINTSPTIADYGTNGFFILKDGNSVTDQSGKGNNFTVAGGTLTKTEDSPSNVFCTMNPLATSSYSTLSQGNTVSTGNTAADNGNTYGTLSASSGKWYAECKPAAQVSTYPYIGIKQIIYHEFGRLLNSTAGIGGYSASTEFSVPSSGSLYSNNTFTSSWMASYTTSDIIGIAVDYDNGASYVSKNGVWQNSGDPTSGASKTGASATWTPSSQDGFVFYSGDYNGSSAKWNFGNGVFGTTAVASAGTNASGIGIFEYDVPTGYTALSTKGLNL